MNSPLTIFLQAEDTKLYTVIDTFMIDVLTELQTAINAVTGIYFDDARVLCAIMMFFYLTMKAYTLITGDGKVTLIPLLRPFAFFLLVVNFNGVIGLLSYPLEHMDAQAHNAFTDVRVNINESFDERQRAKDRLIAILFDETEDLKKLSEQDSDFLETGLAVFSGEAFSDFIDDLSKSIAKSALYLQSRISSGLQRLVEYIILMIFKGCVYLLYFIRIFILAVLRMIGPIVFALSIIAPFRDLWSQWISKFVAVSLYGAFAHIAIMLAFILIKFGIDADIKSTNDLITSYENNETTAVGAVLQTFTEGSGGGTALIMCAFTGIFGLIMVPLIATWILGANSTTQVGSKAMTGTVKLITGK